jgi:hypothetical protein
MKIVGFGDSFIMQNFSYDKEELRQLYLNLVGEELNATVEWLGVSGTGPWDAFFKFMDYPEKDKIDVAVFAWSEANRLYHPTVKPLNYASVMNSLENPGVSKRKTWIAAQQYYEYLHDTRKADYEVKALYTMFDEMSKLYPNTKFIHMWAYPMHDIKAEDQFARYKHPDKFEYHYTWKNGVEIRPALIHHSVMDEWPDNIHEETRSNHLTFRMHRLVANALLQAIKKYNVGEIVEIERAKVTVTKTKETPTVVEETKTIEMPNVELPVSEKKTKKKKKQTVEIVESVIVESTPEPEVVIEKAPPVPSGPITRSLLSKLGVRP